MDELGRRRVTDVPDEPSFADRLPDGEPLGRGVEVSVQEDVVAELPPFAERVARDHGRSEQRAREEDVGVSLLVLEVHEEDGFAFALRDVDAAVADVAQVRAVALAILGHVEIVAADDVVTARHAGWDRVTVCVVVGGTIGAPWNLIVDDPSAGFVVVRVRQRGRIGAVFARSGGNANARVAVGERAGDARRAARRELALVAIAARIDQPIRRRRGRRRAERSERGGEERREREGRDPSERHDEYIMPRPARSFPTCVCYPRPRMPPTDTTGALIDTLDALFDAERSVRRAHIEIVDTEPKLLLPLIEKALRDSLDNDDEDERTLRLVRLAAVLGELEGPKPIDMLIDILGCEDPEARHAAGVALEDLAYDRFKEVALGVERALERLPAGNLALSELPYLLADIPEGGVMKLLARFLAHADPEAVAGAIEALVELGDPSAAPLLAPLEKDTRTVQLEDDEGEDGKVGLGELATEARQLLMGAPDGDARADAGRSGKR